MAARRRRLDPRVRRQALQLGGGNPHQPPAHRHLADDTVLDPAADGLAADAQCPRHLLDRMEDGRRFSGGGLDLVC